MRGAGEACEEGSTTKGTPTSKRNRQQSRCALIAIFNYIDFFSSSRIPSSNPLTVKGYIENSDLMIRKVLALK